MVEGLQMVDTTDCLRAVAHAPQELVRVPGFVLPSWEALANSARPPAREPDQHEPGCQRAAWQHEGSDRLEEAFRESLFVTMTDSERALVRSQGGPGAGAAFSACPTCAVTRIDLHLFRTLFLRRLLSKRTYRCRHPLDFRGHQRAVCARAGAGEERLRCRECCRLDLPRMGSKSGDEHDGRRHGPSFSNPKDSRRLEIVHDGLPLFGSAQLAIDTTLVSVLHCDGSARARVAHVDGAATVVARRRKERMYPELVGQRAHPTGGPGGRGWGTLVRRNQEFSEPVRESQGGWRLRWQALLSCTAAKAFAASLLDLRGGQGASGDAPWAHEVENTFKYDGLSGLG